jgi:hypothetical protein
MGGFTVTELIVKNNTLSAAQALKTGVLLYIVLVYMKKMIISMAILLIVFGVISSVFNPKTSNLPVHLAVFVLIYAMAVNAIAILIKLSNHGLNKAKVTLIACITAFCPLSIISLQTIGGLSIINLILTILIPLIVIWYILKRNG